MNVSLGRTNETSEPNMCCHQEAPSRLPPTLTVPPDFLTSPEGVPVARGLGADPVPVADRPAEDGVLVAVQLRLGHHEAGVVLRATVLQTWQDRGSY